MSQTYLTLLRPTLGKGILLDLRLRARCLHPEVRRSFSWAGGVPCPNFMFLQIQQQTGQAHGRAASLGSGAWGPSEKAEAGRPGGCLPGGLSLALTSQSARPGELCWHPCH